MKNDRFIYKYALTNIMKKDQEVKKMDRNQIKKELKFLATKSTDIYGSDFALELETLAYEIRNLN